MRRYKKIARAVGLSIAFLSFSFSLKAESPPPPPSISNPFVIIMIVIIALLALAIGMVAKVVMGAAFDQREKEKQESRKDENKFRSSTVSVIVVLLLLSLPGFSQSDTGTAANTSGNIMEGISSTAFYLMAGVILIEVIVLVGLMYNLTLILNLEKNRKAVAIAETEKKVKKVKPSWWDRMNKFKPIEQEVDLDLGHNYDGIRELDNRLPPWWLYGFYTTILFACIYLWRYHVSHTAPSSTEEFQIAMQQAEVQKEAYLKKAANNVDETNVKQLTSPTDLAAGKGIFEATCSPCHGKNGEGIVGPNLTDNYWLHGGSVQDIFKTIKYGYPEKGMKSWKDDYSPVQIAQLAGFVMSLQGTNPPNPKAPQGTVYSSNGATAAGNPADSTKTIIDTLSKASQ